MINQYAASYAAGVQLGGFGGMKRNIGLIASVCALSAVTFSANASAQAGAYDRVSGPQLVDIMRAQGFDNVSYDTDSYGDPIVESEIDGVTFHVEFYNCEGDMPDRACRELRFFAGFDLANGMSLEQINQWNYTLRFGKAYVDSDSDPFLEMNLDVDGGLSRDLIESNLAIWNEAFSNFMEFIGWDSAPVV